MAVIAIPFKRRLVEETGFLGGAGVRELGQSLVLFDIFCIPGTADPPVF